ncbi:MAG: hypothetical protein ACREKL_11850, partial [Chthoniobacterales bacterium]
MKPEIPPRVENPCPTSWDEMNGDAKRRFCDHCQHHVHNLSEMNAAERSEILQSQGRVCVTYTTDARGALITHASPHWLSMLLSRMRVAFVTLVAAILPIGLSSCVTRTTGIAPPAPDKNTGKAGP